MGDNLPELSDEETEYLEANYSDYRLQPSDGAKSGVIIPDFALPVGYTAEKSDLLIVIPQGYPGTQLDMFYFDPPLAKQNGNGIGALASESHFERNWQRWSRHYTWEPGVHNLVYHIEYVKNELKTEAER